MFVWKSKYDSLELKHTQLKAEHTTVLLMLKSLQGEYARIVSSKDHWQQKWRELHHEQMMGRTQSQRAAWPSDSDIKQLISLCHPDKHGGSKVANEITAKLIQMRKK